MGRIYWFRSIYFIPIWLTLDLLWDIFLIEFVLQKWTMKTGRWYNLRKSSYLLFCFQAFLGFRSPTIGTFVKPFGPSVCPSQHYSFHSYEPKFMKFGKEILLIRRQNNIIYKKFRGPPFKLYVCKVEVNLFEPLPNFIFR